MLSTFVSQNESVVCIQTISQHLAAVVHYDSEAVALLMIREISIIS